MNTELIAEELQELEAEQQRLMAERAKLREAAQALQSAINDKARALDLAREEKRLRDKFGPDAQIIAPNSIESSEAVNGV